MLLGCLVFAAALAGSLVAGWLDARCTRRLAERLSAQKTKEVDAYRRQVWNQERP